jgi:hypothetical protein
MPLGNGEHGELEPAPCGAPSEGFARVDLRGTGYHFTPDLAQLKRGVGFGPRAPGVLMEYRMEPSDPEEAKKEILNGGGMKVCV